jgi:hypothetical protein
MSLDGEPAHFFVISYFFIVPDCAKHTLRAPIGGLGLNKE